MQISIGKDGTKLKLTKREWDTLGAAFQMLVQIGKHGGGELSECAEEAASQLDKTIKAIEAVGRVEQTAAA